MSKVTKPKKVQVCYCKDVTTVRLAAEWGRETLYGEDCWCASRDFGKRAAYKRMGDIALKRKMFTKMPR